MFHLDAWIDLDEIDVFFFIQEEFDRAGIVIPNLSRDRQCIVKQGLAGFFAQTATGCKFDHFLESPLHRAVALKEVYQIAFLIPQHLHLDVLGSLDEFLKKNRVVTESRERLAAGLNECGGEIFIAADNSHPSPAPTGYGFEHQRVANTAGLGQSNLQGIEFQAAGFNHRQTGRDGIFPGLDLVAQLRHGFGRRTDKNNSLIPAASDERHVFGQKAVTRMDCVHIVEPRHCYDAIDIEVWF